MKTSQLYKNLEELLSPQLSCTWDNDGLSVLPEPGHESRRVLVSLDVREEVIEYAEKNGFDTVITHHPLIFSGLKELSGRTVVSGKAARLIRAGIAAMSFHTRFDAADGGVSDVLCRTLGLEPCMKFGEGDCGRICDAGEMTLDGFVKKAKEIFGTAHFFCEKGGDTVRRIAVCGGSAGDLVADAISLGADTMICGEMRYHSAIDAADSGLSVVCVGHYESEAPALMRLSELVREAGAEEIVIYEVKQYAV